MRWQPFRGVFYFLLLLPVWVAPHHSHAQLIDIEICGDGIDNMEAHHGDEEDCPTGWVPAKALGGCDKLCPGPDKDRDGYPDSLDCDDTDRNIYPGISVACSAGCGSGTRTCQSDGSYTECSCAPLCEATGSASCYYISQSTGNDSNSGTYASPWATYLNVVTYYTPGDRPSGWVQLQAGDFVYFMAGTYDDTYVYYPSPDPPHGLFFRFLSGADENRITLKAYPGNQVAISSKGKGGPIYILQSSGILLEGLEVTDGYGAGIQIADSSYIEMRNLRVHNNDGKWEDNMAGVYAVASSNIHLHHTILHDNYDIEDAPNGGGGNRNISLFKGGNVRVSYNTIFHSQLSRAGCLMYKHSQMIENTEFKADSNVLFNCEDASIGSGSFNSMIHDNLIVDSVPIILRDWGGETYLNNIRVYNNTLVNSRGKGFVYTPTSSWATLPLGTSSIGPVYFYNNIVTVNPATMSAPRSVVEIGHYQSDALYEAVHDAELLDVYENCYYDSGGAPTFSLFGANGGAYGVLGDVFAFLGWQGEGYDSGSAIVDPALDSALLQPTAESCAGYGWRPTSSDSEPEPEPSPALGARSFFGRFIR
jgi:parallel beta-helix repeat protein